MITSINASPAYMPTQSGGGNAVELAKLRKEYSACINCSSAKTTEGARNIHKLDNQIKTLEARMEQSKQIAPAAEANRTESATATSGSLIDIYA